MKSCVIRPLVFDDLAEVAAIAQQFEYNSWTYKIFVQSLRADYIGWVVFDEEAEVIRGFMICLCHDDECQLMNIGVHPDDWHRGLGKQMLQYLIKYSKKQGISRILLEVRASNQKAIQLYKNHGFTQIGTRKGYYPIHSGREDALVLVFTQSCCP